MPSPWAQLPDIAGANIYRMPPVGPITVPAIVYAPDVEWIERRQSYTNWLENYVAVCIVSQSAGGVDALYDMALALKAAVDDDRTMAAWEWRGVSGIGNIEQAGLTYMGATVRLSFRAEY